MTTQYTPILKLALPVTGELSGTWGSVVNDNITSMVEQAVAGLSTINTWTANAHTLTTADGTSSEARCAMLVLATGAGGTALTAAGEVICPAASKLYVVKNGTSFAVTVKTSAGTGVAIPAGDTAFVFCDGTNVNACVTTIVNGHISGNLTVDGNTTLGDATSDTITATARFNTDLLPSTDNARDLGSSGNSWRTLYCDTSVLTPLVTATNLQVTNIKANDGTAVAVLTDSTGATDFSKAFTLSATTQNISLGASQTTGTFVLGGTAATGAITLDQSTKAHTLNIGSGATENATTKTINIGTGGVSGSTTTITIGSSDGTTTTFNGTVNVITLDLTNLEVTNIKAKDGTAAMSIADSTGVVTFIKDEVVNGVTVGRGAGAVATNTAVGASALAANTTGLANAAFAENALVSNTSGNYNTAVGRNTLYTNTTGSTNTAVGYETLYANTTGASNVGIGYQALASNTTASYNTAVGYVAGYSITTGQYNTAVGHRALYGAAGDQNAALGHYALAVNTGTQNTAIGANSLQSNTSGNYNTAVGFTALNANTTASNNTAVGYQAGYSNTTGTGLAALGYQAGYTNNGNGNTAIGGGNAFIGAALYANSSGNNNVGVGSGALTATTVSNNTAVGYAAATANTTGTFNVAVGTDSLRSNTYASSNTAVGYQAAYSNISGSRITALGYQSFYSNTTSSDNTAIGWFTLYSNSAGTFNTAVGGGDGATGSTLSNNTTGSYNTGLGFQALRSNTTASNNTAVGYQAAYSNTTGTSNTAVGFQSQFGQSIATQNTSLGMYALYSGTGSFNVAIGYLAMGDSGKDSNYNVAVGVQALQKLTTGGSNTAMGLQALLNNTTASNNTAVGYQAGYSNTTGMQNVFVGRQAGYNGTTGNYNVYIGDLAGFSSTTASGNTFVGEYAGYNTTGGGNTFIGTTTGGFGAGYLVTSGTKNSILGGYSGNQNSLDIRTANNYIVLSDGDGNPRLWNNNTATYSAQGLQFVGPAGGESNGFASIRIADSQSVSTDARLMIGNANGAYANLRLISNSTSVLSLDSVVGSTSAPIDMLLNVNGGKIGMGLSSVNASGGVLQLASGITFPATQVASANANTLDDYEEGAWTPTDASGAGLTFTTTGGNYTKIGRQVIVYFNMTFPSTASSAGITIGGLPYPSASAAAVVNPGGGGFTYQTASISNVSFATGASASSFNMWTLAGAQVPNSDASTYILRGYFTYFTD